MPSLLDMSGPKGFLQGNNMNFGTYTSQGSGSGVHGQAFPRRPMKFKYRTVSFLLWSRWASRRRGAAGVINNANLAWSFAGRLNCKVLANLLSRRRMATLSVRGKDSTAFLCVNNCGFVCPPKLIPFK